MQTLLVPLDSSVCAPKVLACAAILARSLQARLVLLHVIEPAPPGVTVEAGMGIVGGMDIIQTPPQPFDAGQEEASKKALELLAAPLRDAGLGVECQISPGTPVDAILSRAKALSADYIVLGSHGHGALFHLFVGSVVTGVLQHGLCPVVVVPVRE